MEEHQFPSFNLPMLFITFFFMLMVLKIWKRKSKSSTLNLPPGPLQLPMIGSMLQLIGCLPHRRFAELANKYGPVMLFQVGELTNIVISSPEAAKEVMKTHDVIFAQRPKVSSATIINYNNKDIAFSPYGPYWRQLRKMCTLELLSAKRVQSFRYIREEEASKIIASLSSSSPSIPINITKIINAYTYRIISRSAFGKIWKGEEDFLEAVEKVMMEVGQGLTLADVFPSIKFLTYLSGMRKRVEKLAKKVDQVFESILNDHRAKRTDKNTNTESEGEDLVDVLLNFQESGDLEFPLTDEHLKAVIMDVFIAGMDTSSTTTEWTMSELIRNPRVMEKAQAEVRRVFDAKGKVDEAGLHQLHYLKAVINETLRVHPPAPLLLPRESKEKCVINGYDIPAKAKVMVNAWALGNDPNYWTEPEKYYPERFIENPTDYKGTHFEFIPFGAGRRICPGLLFGVAAVELPLAQLLFHFDWKLPDGLNPQNLDMTEDFGGSVRRKCPLCLILIPYVPPVLN